MANPGCRIEQNEDMDCTRELTFPSNFNPLGSITCGARGTDKEEARTSGAGHWHPSARHPQLAGHGNAIGLSDLGAVH